VPLRFRCLGTIAHCVATATLPAEIHSSTVEPTKPRWCLDARLLNDATRLRPGGMEGLSCIQSQIVLGAREQLLLDETSAYSNDGIDPALQDLVGYVLFGYVFVYLTLPFGWKLAGWYHQRRGMVITSLLRSRGGTTTRWQDDCWLGSPPELKNATPAVRCVALRRWGYVTLSLCLECGVHMSLEKSVVDPTLVLLALGLWVDAGRRCFHFTRGVPHPDSGHLGAVKDRRGDILRDGAAVLCQLESGVVEFRLLQQLAGRTVSLTPVNRRFRLYTNVTYGLVGVGDSGALVAARWQKPGKPGGVPSVQHRGHQLILAPAIVALLRREVYELLKFVAVGRAISFVDDRHHCVATMETDATPTTLGLFLRMPPAEVPAFSAWSGENLVGLTVPSEWSGIELDGVPVGVTELTAVIYFLDLVTRQSQLRPAFENCRIHIGVDNTEAERAVNSWVAKGDFMAVKWRLLLVLAQVLELLGSTLTCYHVPTAVNRSDEPSRAHQYRDVRLSAVAFRAIATFARQLLGRDLTCDLMSSINCRQSITAAGAALPYVGQLGDPDAGWADVFAQPLDEWDGLVGYLNPPDVIAEMAVRYVLGCDVTVVIVLRCYSEPAPAWVADVRARASAQMVLHAPHSEQRCGEGYLSGEFRVVARSDERVAYLIRRQGVVAESRKRQKTEMAQPMVGPSI
jgi:hypothetical protein